jgi:predicted 2-oxoglutarate/Fe(II)-dependent dioxygenase YbiX
MENSILSAFLTSLNHIRGAGRFCASGCVDFVPPGIVLKNSEDLALPLNGVQAAEVRALAEAAPYGMGTETKLDESVRKCWQIDATELKWTSKKWNECLNEIVEEVTEELGIEGEVSAQPYKLLLYDKGGFFLPHRDTEKVPGMFGTLIICLPSRHTGGELVLRHHGQEERVDFGREFDPAEIHWAAFFADCEHEVLPVTSGHRLCLAYNLVLANAKGHLPSAPKGSSDTLVPGLQHVANTRGDDITAILLEHQYTQESLSVSMLKGDDRARAASLFEAAEKVGLTARLALVTLHQVGQLENDDQDYYSRKYRRGRSTESVTDGEMGEIFEQSLTIEHWLTPQDTKEELGSIDLAEKNLLSLEKIGNGDPDEKEAEGYTGNAGCTMEHWYRRAAIAVWPQNAGPVLLARYDFKAACESFADLAQRGSDMAVRHATALIHEARDRLERFGDVEAEALGIQLRPLLIGISVMGDVTLYEMISRGDLIVAFRSADSKTWAALLRGFGARPLDFVRGYTPSSSIGKMAAPWFCAVDAMLGDAPELLPRCADLLPRLVAGPFIPPRVSTKGDAVFRETSYRSHLILAASCFVTHSAEQDKLRSWLLDDISLLHLREVLVPALLIQTHRSWFAKPGSLAPGILTTVIEILRAETARPIEPYPDWRRPAPATAFPDALIKALLHFMADPTQKTHEVRRPQGDRLMVEEYVKRHNLDLDLRTERKGTPHTLICTKNTQSHLQALKQRTADEKLLTSLREVLGAC